MLASAAGASSLADGKHRPAIKAGDAPAQGDSILIKICFITCAAGDQIQVVIVQFFGWSVLFIFVHGFFLLEIANAMTDIYIFYHDFPNLRSICLEKLFFRPEM